MGKLGRLFSFPLLSGLFLPPTISGIDGTSPQVFPLKAVHFYTFPTAILLKFLKSQSIKLNSYLTSISKLITSGGSFLTANH